MTRDELIAAYQASNRHYHNLAHIEDCLAALSTIEDLSAAERNVLTEAIWWHDVVYDPTRSDNEERSAELAETSVVADISDEVGRLIRLTKTHRVDTGDRLGAILVSIDLSILGADRPHYEAYAAAIRREYAHVPDEPYRSGRSDVLRRFLAMPAIYPDAAFARTYDRRARDNIGWELTSLG